MIPGQALEPFVRKWLALWPEQAVLDVFIPERQKPAAHAWGSLLFELHECAFGLEHDPVREQKSLWWSQELQDAERGSARHPVTQALQGFPCAYGELALPLLNLAQQAPIRAGDRGALAGLLRPFAEAIIRIEQGLFGGDLSHPDSVTAQLLVMRLPQGLQAFDRALIPMNLLARHQSLELVADERALLQDWLADLAGLLPPAEQGGNWFRAAQNRFTRRRIRHLQSTKAPGISPGHVWDAWRAMRSRRPD